VCEQELHWLDMSTNVKKSASMRVGRRFNAKCNNIITAEGHELTWVVVWCVMSFLPFLLPKLILLAFWLSWGSNKPKILGFNFSQKSTPFYVTVFKMAGSKLNMPHIDPSKLHTIIYFVSEFMFLIMRNALVYVKVILEWQPY